uniref:ABC transporter ATP-binding protein n=1 Tax=Flavobacterium sp. TaxID=239 RepID=UPI004049A9E0
MLTLQNISFSYQDDKIINNVSLTLKKGQHLSIMGESGCGKSTLLQIIYGLHDLEHGEIHWNKTKITGPKYNLVPGMSFIKYLAQDFDLMPFISVEENVGKYLSNINMHEKNERIHELLEVVEMLDFKKTKAKYLSGGQMQRVALAKVLAKEPKLLLLDEPFSHIDNFRKNSLRRKVFEYVKQKEITCITASHDKEDVLGFTDLLFVMKNGEKLELDKPENLYNLSKNHYTKSLFDDCNIIEGQFINQEENETYLFYPHELEICEVSKLKIKVINSYFNGDKYKILSENLMTNKSVIFESRLNLKKDELFFIQIKPKTQNRRI